MKRLFSFGLLLLLFPGFISAQKKKETIRIVNVDSGWANNSINTVVFRKNSIVSFKDTQFIAFYDSRSSLQVRLNPF